MRLRLHLEGARLISILTAILIITLCSKNTYAIVDPLATANNKFGIHILFTTELVEAARLVNSNGGDWGYVTIPIQTGDKNLEKWQKFMDSAKQNHVIPIIRIATENYYFNTKVWRRPDRADILDFANFLDSLDWPVKNRYVVIFNEVNRADEWGDDVNPAEYAEILQYAVSFFKSKSEDFFIISAGLDNASANVSDNSLNQYNFMIQMNRAVPGIFSQIDGLGSHSYPNPGFLQPPWIITDKSISSFKFEKNLADELSGKNLPVFITETGWSNIKLSENQIGQYFIYAFKSVWTDNSIVAVTPFLLQAGVEPFSQFSLLSRDGEYNEISRALQKISKIKGKPTINIQPSSYFLRNTGNIPFKTFPKATQYETSSTQAAKAITPFLKWLLRLSD